MPWLNALAETGFEKIGEVWAGLDTELRALILQRSVKIYDTTLGEGPSDDNDEPMYDDARSLLHPRAARRR